MRARRPFEFSACRYCLLCHMNSVRVSLPSLSLLSKHAGGYYIRRDIQRRGVLYRLQMLNRARDRARPLQDEAIETRVLSIICAKSRGRY